MSSPGQLSRRDFLQAAGFTVSAAVSGCTRPPEQFLAPPLHQSDHVQVGQRLEYATTCGGCSAGCGVLASVRDGRPTKLEGMPGHPVSRGGLCAAGQASILGLYDDHRVRQPLARGGQATWRQIDAELGEALEAARKENRAVRLLTGADAAASPTTRRMISRFLERHTTARHDAYEGLPVAAIAEAHERAHAVRAIPHYRFDRADLVVSFAADFLGTWISPVEFTAMYARARPQLHVQFESCMSLTGAKADHRVVVSPRELGATMRALEFELALRAGRRGDPAPVLPRHIPSELIKELAAALSDARGRALVVCGSGNVYEQTLALRMNEWLQSVGSTLDLQRSSHQKLSSSSTKRLWGELERGEVEVLILAGVNPVHDLPNGAAWKSILAKAPTFVAIAERLDETAQLATHVCPPPHALESWGDYEPLTGVLSLRQPTTLVFGDTRSLDSSLAAWSGDPSDALEILQRRWRSEVFDPTTDGDSFEAFWDRCVQTGWLERDVVLGQPERTARAVSISGGSSASAPASGHFDLVAYPTVALLDGRQGFNPWLLELPDPLTKVTWESCASLAPEAARLVGVTDGDIVRIEVVQDGAAGAIVELPVVLQPGQHHQVIAAPLGFGQVASARFARIGPRWLGAPTRLEGELVGVNVSPLLVGVTPGAVVQVRVSAAGRHKALARTQIHSQLPAAGSGSGAQAAEIPVRYVGRDEILRVSPGSHTSDVSRRALWSDEHPYPAARWGMVIDLDACTGCSACVIACQVENNTPVVGADEVRRHREMHWLRIDRYFMEDQARVRVAHQPMTCHHCGNAPCETVCPVNATTHSSDGLNQQVYSRCVGTRYCMNNCPFKVRRFNWFHYAHDDQLHNLVLNPDVVVRTRGVAEKCTFCAHRIQDARLNTRMSGGKLEDGAVTPACAQSCAASAITFGDLNDPSSRVSRAAREGRSYTLLDGLNLKPGLHYRAIVERRGRDARG